MVSVFTFSEFFAQTNLNHRLVALFRFSLHVLNALSITFRCLWYSKSQKPTLNQKPQRNFERPSSRIGDCLINLTLLRERDRNASTSSWLYWRNENKLFSQSYNSQSKKVLTPLTVHDRSCCWMLHSNRLFSFTCFSLSQTCIWPQA